MDVDMVSFTGSTETGRRFLRYAADSNLKKVVLECGGKNPAVVFDDAENLDHVAEHVVNAAFWNAGQNCSATSRLIVHSVVKASLMERSRAYARLEDRRPAGPRQPHRCADRRDHCAKVRGYLEDKGDGPFVAPVIEVKADDPQRATKSLALCWRHRSGQQ